MKTLSSVAVLLAALSALLAAPGAVTLMRSRKYPVFIPNAQEDTRFAWAEGAGWERGGSLAWQVYDADGNPTGPPGQAAGVPMWSLISAVARPDGAFLIVF